MRAVTFTDIGKRSANEDSVLAKSILINDQSIAAAAIADGMGGYANGGRDSQIAISTFSEALRSMGKDFTDPSAISQVLDSGYEKADRMIRQLNAAEEESSGTTMTSLVLIGSQVLIKHIGDSRCYRLRSGVLTQLTADHVAVRETEESNAMLSRCLGLGRYEKPDTVKDTAETSDVYMVCSDGFYKHLKLEDMVKLAADIRNNINSFTQLVSILEARGEEDNISIAMILL